MIEDSLAPIQFEVFLRAELDDLHMKSAALELVFDCERRMVGGQFFRVRIVVFFKNPLDTRRRESAGTGQRAASRIVSGAIRNAPNESLALKFEKASPQGGFVGFGYFLPEESEKVVA